MRTERKMYREAKDVADRFKMATLIRDAAWRPVVEATSLAVPLAGPVAAFGC